MFTGLVEETGIVKSVVPLGNAARIAVEGNKVIDDLKIDDSISLNGVCQTVVKIQNRIFEVDAVEETLRKTTLGSFRPNAKVNLERAVRPETRLGGHIVQGHVDCTGHVVSVVGETISFLLTVNFPQEYSKYIVHTGSICIDGVSLTVARLESNNFTSAVIPHTWKCTTLSQLKAGDSVNLEFDILGKYIERLLGQKDFSLQKPKSFLDNFISQPDF
jgi:riboflavin synthase